MAESITAAAKPDRCQVIGGRAADAPRWKRTIATWLSAYPVMVLLLGVMQRIRPVKAAV